LNIENLTKIIKNKNIRGGGWAMKEVGKKVKKKIKEKIRKKASESLFVSMALIMWSSLVINLKLLWTKIKLIFTRTRRVLLVNRGVIAWSILMTCTTLKLLGIKIKLVIPYTEEDDGRPYLSLAEKLGHKKFSKKDNEWKDNYNVTIHYYLNPKILEKINSITETKNQ